MSGDSDQQEVFDYIREYLKYWELNTSLDMFEEELKKRGSQPNKKSKGAETKLESVMRCPSSKTKNEQQLQKQNKAQLKKYQEVLQAGRQIFSVSINLLQIIHNIKEGGNKYDALNETIQNYKIQLGKHHKIIINQGRVEGTELISQSVIKDHKAKLQQHFNDKYIQGIIQILLSLRVNALQIAPELRKNLVDELIRRDIFKISQTDNFDFLIEILNIKNKSLRHAVTSLISVIVSTLRGIEYLTNGGTDVSVLDRIIKILKEQDNGSVTQRFCLAILQKCSVKDSIIRVYWDNQMITWVISLVRKSLITKIHMFCLDFATAMLANVVHSKTCQALLQKKPQLVVSVIDSILKIIKEPPQKIEVSVLMHLLITLSYLCRDRFKRQLEETHVQRRISQFIDFYQNTNKEEGEAAEMDKRTVLDLCNHMFHGKEEDFDTEERIRQYENEQGQLIFQCFQDEVN